MKTRSIREIGPFTLDFDNEDGLKSITIYGKDKYITFFGVDKYASMALYDGAGDIIGNYKEIPTLKKLHNLNEEFFTFIEDIYNLSGWMEKEYIKILSKILG